MPHLKKRSSKYELAYFSVYVLLLLTHSCKGQFQVVGPFQPVTVTLGDDVSLPCHLKPTVDAVDMTFEWGRPDLNPRFVHVWHERQDLHVNQHPLYKGRTSVSINKLKQGDISLKLSKVQLSDEGKYRCYFPDMDKVATVQLVVGSTSSPVISLAGIDRSSSGVVLQCKSKDWYPEPEVLWLDGEGNLLSAEPTETVRGSDDLYTVSSRLTVENRLSNSFTCRVQQKDINQTREANIHVPDDFFVGSSSSAACITISLISCFTCVLAVIFAVWKWRQNKIKTEVTLQKEHQQLMAESEKVEDVEKKMADIAEALKRKEEGHKAMVDTLTKQANTLKVEKKKVEELVEGNEQELLSVEKNLQESDQGPGYLKLKEITYKYKTDLNDTLKHLEMLLLSTERLLQNTEV